MRPKPISFRRAEPADIPALKRMHYASLHRLGAAYYTAAEINGFFARVDTADPAIIRDGTFFVAESGGRLIASGGWTRRVTAEPSDEVVARMCGLFVDPEFARRGLGRRIMDIAEPYAVLHGAERLDVLATLCAVPFYAAMGYDRGAPVDIALPAGGAIAAVRMSKSVRLAEPARLAA